MNEFLSLYSMGLIAVVCIIALWLFISVLPKDTRKNMIELFWEGRE
jgi:hypothetical protein